MSRCIGTRDLRIRLVEEMFVRLLEELVIVSVVYSNANQDGARYLKGFFECWPDLIRCIDHEADCSKGLGIFNDIDWSEPDPPTCVCILAVPGQLPCRRFRRSKSYERG